MARTLELEFGHCGASGGSTSFAVVTIFNVLLPSAEDDTKMINRILNELGPIQVDINTIFKCFENMKEDLKERFIGLVLLKL